MKENAGLYKGPDGHLLVRITAPHFCAGLRLCRAGNVCAPILQFMRDWRLSDIRRYCVDMEWTVEVVDLRGHDRLPPLDRCKDFPADASREGK